VSTWELMNTYASPDDDAKDKKKKESS